MTDLFQAISLRRALDHKCLTISCRFARASFQDTVDAALYADAIRSEPDRCLSAPMFASPMYLDDPS